MCVLCQQTLPKRWFGNRTMTSFCDVTNSAHQIQMTTLCRWMNPPPWKVSAYATAQDTITFGSVLGLQVNSVLQPSTCWEAFVAGPMLRRPETTKERVESTILSIIAIKVRYLTRFALLLQLRILRYMCRDHVAKWTYANNSDRNWHLNKIRFSYLHYTL